MISSLSPSKRMKTEVDTHTFSRKQTSPRVTSAQISKRGSWRTKHSNSRASWTCWKGKSICLSFWTVLGSGLSHLKTFLDGTPLIHVHSLSHLSQVWM